MGCFMTVNNIEFHRSAFRLADLLGFSDMGWHEVKHSKIKEVFEQLKLIDRNEYEDNIFYKLSLLIDETNDNDYIYNVYFDY